MKANPCPWCKWTNTTIVPIAKGNHDVYVVACKHCGLQCKKPSIFKWLAVYRWNRTKAPYKGARKRYNLYGREF